MVSEGFVWQLTICVAIAKMYSMRLRSLFQDVSLDNESLKEARCSAQMEKNKFNDSMTCWLVVEPTHLKNMLVKLDHFPK